FSGRACSWRTDVRGGADHRPGRDPRRTRGRGARRPINRRTAHPWPSAAGKMTETASGGRVAQRLARLSFVDAGRAAELLSGPTLRWWNTETNAPVDSHAASVV